MNLDKYNNKQALEALIQNEEEFFNVVSESNGFILEMLKNNKVTPDLNMLLDNINVFTVPYVVENYKLNTEQTQKISNFLNEESHIRIQKTLSQEQVEKHLKEGIPIPKTVMLSVEEINKFHKEIIKQYNIEDSEIETVLTNSFRKFTLEEIFKIRKDFLLNESNLLANKKAFFNDEKYRELYKEIVFKADKAAGMRQFQNYIFSPEDKDLVLTLLKNDNADRYWKKPYSDYSNIQGFTALVNKFEYFEKFNRDDLSSFSNGEIENNPEFFRKIFLDDNEDKNTYEVFNNLFRKKLTVRQFKAIFDQEFVEKYIDSLTKLDRSIHNFFGHQDAEYDRKIIDKRAHIAKLVSSIFAEDKVLESGVNFRDVTDLYSIFTMLKDLKNERYNPEDEEATNKDIEATEQNLQRAFTEVIPKDLKTESFDKIVKHSEYTLTPHTIDLADQYFAQNVNVNNFFFLMDVYGDNRKSRSSERGFSKFLDNLAQYIERMHADLISRNNHDELVSINTILNYYKDKDDHFVKKLLKDTPNRKGYINSNGDEYNFLAYEVNDLKKLPEDLWGVVYNLRNEFADYIIKNKIVAPNDFIYRCLHITKTSDTTTKFLTNYVKIHRAEIEKDEKLLATFLSNERQGEIFPLNSTAHLDGFYNEIMFLMKREFVIEQKKKQLQKLYPREDFPYSRDGRHGKFPEIDLEAFDENVEIDANISKDEAKFLYLNLYEKSSLLHKSLNAKAELISYGFMTEKIQQLIKDRNFETLLLIKDKGIKYNNEPFVDYVNNISFKELMDNLNNKSFNKILKDQLRHNDETEIKFPNFTYEQNMELGTKLWEIYKGFKKNSSESLSSYDYKFFHFFTPENRDFIKEFAIKEIPQFIFYGYDFLPKESDAYIRSNYINSPYSNEEIYQAFLNLEAKDGFFSYKDTNANCTHFLSSVFSTNNRNNKDADDSKMKEFLNFIKDKNEMFYAVMANQNIFVNVLDYGRSYGNEKPKKYKTRDEAINNYFHEVFDFDIVLKGLEKIVEKLTEKNVDEDNQDIINRKLATYCITSVVHNTYYEDYDDSGRTKEYQSATSKEDTLKLMKFLFEKAPMHFVERHVIGQALEPVSFFKENIKEFYNFENIKNFILPNNDVSTEYLRMDGQENEQRNRLIGFTKAIIEYAVEQKDSKVIDFLNHTIKQHEFIQKEMSWNHRHRAYPGVSEMFIEAITEDKVIRGLLQNAKLKMDLDSTLEVKEPVVKKKRKI